MTEQEQILLDDFKAKLRLLMKKYDHLRSDNESLKEQVNLLSAEIDELKKNNENLEKKYANLKVARVIAFSEEDQKLARQRINKIVRELDKCIAKLNI